MSRTQDGHLSSKGQRLVESHAEYIVERYPDGGERFTLSGRVAALPTVDIPFNGPHRQLRGAGCIRVVDQRRAPNELGEDKPVNVYEVPTHVVARAEGYIAGGWTPCPCGHRGLQNYTDGFECGWDGCDRLFDRAEVEP